MEELLEFLLKPLLRLLLGILRVLQFIAWEFAFSTVGWAIGWSFLRLVTLGGYPKERFSEVEQCSHLKSFLIELLGLLILGAAIYGISGLIDWL